MNNNIEKNDVIAAPASAVGGGSIATIRVSGQGSISLVNNLFKGKDLKKLSGYSGAYGAIEDADGVEIDQVVIFVFRSPHSYTGEDGVEISCHGNIFAVEKILSILISAGARIAEPGEFTQRAFLNDRLDMTQAEAVADLIAAETGMAYDNAYRQLQGVLKKKIEKLIEMLKDISALLELELDFSEEDISFVKKHEIVVKLEKTIAHLQKLEESFKSAKVMKEGIKLAIVGKPNTGKSSLLNAFLKIDRAIVSHIPGTTRDTVEENVHFGKLLVKMVDTAGIRKSSDQLEEIGIKRSRKAIRDSHFVLFVFDLSAPLDQEDFDIINNDLRRANQNNALIIANKADLRENKTTRTFLSNQKIPLMSISAKNGTNITDVEFHVEQKVLDGLNFHREELVVTNLRQKEALRSARISLSNGLKGIKSNFGNELISDDVRVAIKSLEIIIGKITSTDILNAIFSQFCIGK